MTADQWAQCPLPIRLPLRARIRLGHPKLPITVGSDVVFAQLSKITAAASYYRHDAQQLPLFSS